MAKEGVLSPGLPHVVWEGPVANGGCGRQERRARLVLRPRLDGYTGDGWTHELVVELKGRDSLDVETWTRELLIDPGADSDERVALFLAVAELSSLNPRRERGP